jgi:hypothetical protein
VKPGTSNFSLTDPDMASFHEAICDMARGSIESQIYGGELFSIIANINHQVRRALELAKKEASKNEHSHS